jgi:hypothetical protein
MRVRRGGARALKTAIIAATFFVGGATYAAIASADAPPPQPKTTIDHDGTHAVGTDIAAGAESSVGPVGSDSGSRARLGSFNGSDVIWQRSG